MPRSTPQRLKTDIDSFGRVEQPEAQLAAISARIGGRVDKLYVQYTGERVRRGQPVAELYSPEVATAIEEYRLAVENRSQLAQSDDADAQSQADALVTATQRKLELWGVKDIKPAAANGTPHVTIYANASGTVVDRKVTQGQYVNAGDTLFTVADLSQVWIKADVYEEQLPQIRPGQDVEITSEALPNQILHGHVDFIEPAANPQTRTVPVHVHVANPGMRLVPGMFVSANLLSPPTAKPSSFLAPPCSIPARARSSTSPATMASSKRAKSSSAPPLKISSRSPADSSSATRSCSTATSSSIRRRTSAPALAASSEAPKSSAAMSSSNKPAPPRQLN